MKNKEKRRGRPSGRARSRQKRQLQKAKAILLVLGGVVLLVAGYCSVCIIRDLVTNSHQRNSFQVLTEQIEAAQDSEETQGTEETDPCASLFKEYPDMVAWIRIDETVLSYPVMQTPDSPNYYLKRDLQGQYSTYGVPYLQEDCSLDTSDNLIVYGHCMKNGDMFGSLPQYTDKSYWEEHPVIEMITPEETREYEIFCVFKEDVSWENAIDYWEFIDAETEKQYNSFIDKIKAIAFYETGIRPACGDQLLTLSTCEYTLGDGRLVVVAHQVEK